MLTITDIDIELQQGISLMRPDPILPVLHSPLSPGDCMIPEQLEGSGPTRLQKPLDNTRRNIYNLNYLMMQLNKGMRMECSHYKPI